jgi:cytochrome c5
MERKVMMDRIRLAGYSFAIAGLVLFSNSVPAQSSATQAKSQAVRNSSASTHSRSHFHSEGERIFVQNCSRCHNAPEGFSPRISGTIVRHMRVRASLSAHDEQELLRYFNP